MQHRDRLVLASLDERLEVSTKLARHAHADVQLALQREQHIGDMSRRVVGLSRLGQQ